MSLSHPAAALSVLLLACTISCLPPNAVVVVPNAAAATVASSATPAAATAATPTRSLRHVCVSGRFDVKSLVNISLPRGFFSLWTFPNLKDRGKTGFIQGRATLFQVPLNASTHDHYALLLVGLSFNIYDGLQANLTAAGTFLNLTLTAPAPLQRLNGYKTLQLFASPMPVPAYPELVGSLKIGKGRSFLASTESSPGLLAMGRWHTAWRCSRW